VAVAAVVVLAYLPYLLGLVTPAVFGFNSGLATEPVGPYLGSHVGLPWIDPNVGFVSQALGHLAALDLVHGHLPWWNHFEGLGVPLAGEGQSAALFPLTPLLALGNGLMWFHLVLQVIAGLATQRLLREMGMARWVTIAGGVLFGLNGTFAWLTNAAFNPVPFLPLMLWGVERARRRSFREGWSGWLILAVGVALSLYAGFPETAYLNGLFVLCWAAVRFAQAPDGHRGPFAATVGIGTGVGILASAPFLAPFASNIVASDVGGHAGGFEFLHLPTAAVNTVGMPYLFGPIFGYVTSDHSGILAEVWGGAGGYLSAAVVVLALTGLLAGRDRGLRVFLGVWLLLSLGKVFGVAPIEHVVNVIPVVARTAFSRYGAPSWELAAIVLACLGLETAGAREGEAARRRRQALAVAAALTVAALGLELLAAQGVLRSLAHVAGFTAIPTAAVLWALATVLVVVGAGIVARPRLARAVLGVVLVVDALVMFMVPELSAPRRVPVDVAPVTYLQQHLGLSRFVTLGAISPNYGSYFGIAELNSHDLPVPGPWSSYIRNDLEPNERAQQFDMVTSLDPGGPSPYVELLRNLANYEAVGVRYVVAPTPWGDLPGTKVFSDRYTSIYRLADTAPYYSVVSGSCRIGKATWVRVQVSCHGPAVLERLELYDEGWSADVSGTPATVHEYDGLVQSVRLPGGPEVVTFHYTPPDFAWAVFAVVLGLFLAAWAALAPYRGGESERTRRRRAALGPPRSAGRIDYGIFDDVVIVTPTKVPRDEDD